MFEVVQMNINRRPTSVSSQARLCDQQWI